MQRTTPEGTVTARFDTQVDGDGAVCLSGELDFTTADAFVRAAVAALDGSGGLTLDLSHLGFIDSSGIAAILAVAEQASEGVTLRRPTDTVRKVLELTGIVGRRGISWADG